MITIKKVNTRKLEKERERDLKSKHGNLRGDSFGTQKATGKTQKPIKYNVI